MRIDLSEALSRHAEWLGSGGRDGKRADLRWADLNGADLNGADLRGAVLSGAILSRAVLSGAVLNAAVLRWAVLDGADLNGADLRGADLYGADLRGADLRGADLRGADLRGADLRGAEGIDPLIAASLEILPRRGEVRGFKACSGGAIVEIAVPDGVERSNATGRKCRARAVRVVACHGGEYGTSLYDGSVVYRVGETVECDRWDPDRWAECGGGIHFFLTREEAEAFQPIGGTRPTPHGSAGPDGRPGTE